MRNVTEIAMPDQFSALSKLIGSSERVPLPIQSDPYPPQNQLPSFANLLGKRLIPYRGRSLGYPKPLPDIESPSIEMFQDSALLTIDHLQSMKPEMLDPPTHAQSADTSTISEDELAKLIHLSTLELILELQLKEQYFKESFENTMGDELIGNIVSQGMEREGEYLPRILAEMNLVLADEAVNETVDKLQNWANKAKAQVGLPQDNSLIEAVSRLALSTNSLESERNYLEDNLSLIPGILNYEVEFVSEYRDQIRDLYIDLFKIWREIRQRHQSIESLFREAEEKFEGMNNFKANEKQEPVATEPNYIEVFVPANTSITNLAEIAYGDIRIDHDDIPNLGGRSLLISSCLELNRTMDAGEITTNQVIRLYNARAMNMEFEIGAGTLVDAMVSRAIRVERVHINTILED